MHVFDRLLLCAKNTAYPKRIFLSTGNANYRQLITSCIHYSSKITTEMAQDVTKSFQPKRIRYLSDALLINKVDFPIYYIECLSERHFIVAGGGGSAKTGVHNQINVFELIPCPRSCSAQLVMQFKTPQDLPDAIMNGSMMPDQPLISPRMVAAGANLTIFDLQYKPTDKSYQVTNYVSLHNEQVSSEMKCVKCARSKIVAGGMDGQLTVWDNCSDDEYTFKETQAHNESIDEIDYDEDQDQIVTLSRFENKVAIWRADTLALVKQFQNDLINTDTMKYKFRSTKYATASKTTYLIVGCNSLDTKLGKAKIYRWKTSENKFDKYDVSQLPLNGIMAMTTSSDGRHIGIGTQCGSVYIVKLDNLSTVYSFRESHSNVITDIAFLPSIPESQTLTDSDNCSLLSVSIDRHIVLHRSKSGYIRSMLNPIVFVVAMYFLTRYWLDFQ